MSFKKQTTYTGKLKQIRIFDGNFVDESGEVINLVEILTNVYGDMTFDLSTTSKSEEDIDTESDEEVEIDEDGNIVYE